MMKNIVSWIEKNRFTIIMPIICAAVWVVAVGCEPSTLSPLSGREVNVSNLQIDYDTMLARFNVAAEDIERQYAQQELFIQVLTTLASGGITSGRGFIDLLVGGGAIGLLFDNRRKNTVINSMKRIERKA